MARHAATLQYVDELPRPLFGLSFLEGAIVLVAYALARKIVPHTLLHGAAPLLPATLVYLGLVLRHQVRTEPYLAQVHGFLVRRLLGPPRRPPRVHTILEVDGFTREGLTDDEQEVRLINRLQLLFASLGGGGAVQLIVVNRTRATAEIIAEEQAITPPTPALAELHARQLMRLERLAAAQAHTTTPGGAALRQADLRFYVVVYEPTSWLAVPLAQRVFQKLIGIESEEIGIDDLVEGAQNVLAAMSLTARRVERIADVAEGTPGREGLTTLDAGAGLHAASTYLLWPPGETDPGWLDALVAMPGPWRLALWVHGLDREAERNRLALKRRQSGAAMFAGLVGGKAPGVEEGAAVDETDALILRLRKPDQAIVRGGVYLTCLGASPREARRTARRAQTIIKQFVSGRPASAIGHQWPLYVATRPGLDAAACAWRMYAETMANAYPFNRTNPSTSVGYRIGVTDRGEVVYFNPDDDTLRNALVVTVGLSGMGKTQLTLKLAELHGKRIDPATGTGGRITVLDRSGHYLPLGELLHARVARTPAALDAIPIETQMVVIDLRGQDVLTKEWRDALDRRTQTVIGSLVHLFVLEEAWQMEFMEGALWVRELAARGRHWGGCVWWVTHDPEEVTAHPVIRSIFSAAATKFCFALDDRQDMAARVGAALAASEKEIGVIKGLVEGECYMMRHNKKRGSIVRGKVKVQVDPEERWLFESDPRHWQYKRREVEIARHGGDTWRAVKWLADHVPFDDDAQGAGAL